MANPLIPIEERILTPAEVAQLDRRRRRGQLLIVMGLQFTVIATLVSLWSGQDLAYSPGWMHPVFYWDCLLAIAAIACFIKGIRDRRGINEFFSY
jgi:hypothetical protein